MRVILLISLEDVGGKTVPLGRVLDADVLRAAAQAAIREKRARVTQLQARGDGALSFVAQEELRHLERVLAGLVPEASQSEGSLQ